MIDNLAIGLNTILHYSKSVDQQYLGYSSESISKGSEGGVFAKKYFGQSSVLPYINLAFNTGIIKNDWESFISDSNNIPTKVKNYSSDFNVSGYLGIGIAYMINKSISLNTSLGYSYSIYNATYDFHSFDEYESKSIL